MPSNRSEAPSPDPAPLEVLGLDAAQLTRFKSTFEILALLGGVLAIVIPALGHVSLRHRSRLLGVADGYLEYAPLDVAITGTVVVWESFVRAIACLVAPDTLAWFGWLIIALMIVGAMIRTRSMGFHRVVLALTSIAIYIGGALLLDGIKAGAMSTNVISISSQATFEMRSWLENAGNASRRELVAGLVTLLVIWCAMALRWSWTRTRSRWRYVDGVIVVVLFVELALLVALLPQAHAYARWGREYPQVTGIDPACGEQIAATLQPATQSRAWLVSGGARGEVVLAALPGSAKLTVIPLTHPEGGRCAWSTVTLEVVPRVLSAR